MRLMREGGVIGDSEITAVIECALAILERTGVQVENASILRTLEQHGARVDLGRNICRFPAAVVSDFLSASERHNWSDAPVRFDGHVEIYHGWYLDPNEGVYRSWSQETLLDYVRLAKALPDVGAVTMLGLPLEDFPRSWQPLTEKLFCWKWGIGGGSAIWDTALCQKIHRMWQLWADHRGCEVRELFNGTVYLVSPLKLAATEAAQFAWFAERGLEVAVGSLGSLGGTSPVTLAGALALQTAEKLFLNFLRRAYFGHRDLQLGNSLSVLDLRTGCLQYGRPEQALLNIAGAAVARRLGARFQGHAGLSDAKEPGYEAAMQKASTAICSAHASGRGRIVCGLLAVDEVFSPVQLVLDAETLSWLRRLSDGLSVNPDTLALDAILETGWGGQFLSHPHTAKHCRSELWSPTSFSTGSYARWSADRCPREQDSARGMVQEILRRAPPLEPQMPPRLEKELWEIIHA